MSLGLGTHKFQIPKSNCTIAVRSVCLVWLKSVVKDAIGSQEQWSFGRAPTGVTDMYRQLLLAMECKEAVGIIQRVIDREEVCSRNVLEISL